MPSLLTAPVGQRRRLVTIEQMTESVGDSGRPVETWTPLTQAWMQRLDGSGQEAFHVEGLTSTYDTTWVLPYQADMDPEALNVPKYRRLSYAGRTYDIVSARPVGVNLQIALLTIAKG